MTLFKKDVQLQMAFSVYENKGIFALLLGSGLSRAAEIPTGWEITTDLIRLAAHAKGVEEQTDWAAWYKDQGGGSPNYSTLLEDLAPSAAERRAILHGYIDPTPEDIDLGRKVPTAAHRAIAKLVRDGYIRVIVTTNFDRLMENALREVGIEPTVISSEDSLLGAAPITHNPCYILKLHGDYKDARILNTDEELSSYSSSYNNLLDRIFDEYGLIVSGWSGEWDHALRNAFKRISNKRYPTFWTTRNEVGDGAAELIAHRQARLAKFNDANALFTTLLQQVETLEQTHRQNPDSIELLVGSTKRLLAKAEYKIQLHDLFTKEVERVMELLDGSEFAPQASWSIEEYATRIRRYESASEALASMVGVLGRWGDGTELHLVVNLLHTLYAHAEGTRCGYEGYQNLRSYPSMLIFTAYGLALTHAERFKDLHHMLSLVFEYKHKNKKKMADVFFLTAWQGSKKDYWGQVAGLERRRTPFSDHIFDLFNNMSKRFISLAPSFEMLFNRFEILGSLVHLERHSSYELTIQTQRPDSEAFFPMRPLRSFWDTRITNSLISEIGSSENVSKFLSAGFAQGDISYLELMLKNFVNAADNFH